MSTAVFCRDRYSRTEELNADLPCIWTCNRDLDPRQYPEVAAYLKSSGAVVVDLGNQPLYITHGHTNWTRPGSS